MRSGSRCPAFYGEIPPMRWGILDDDGGYFYCITYTDITDDDLFAVGQGLAALQVHEVGDIQRAENATLVTTA